MQNDIREATAQIDPADVLRLRSIRNLQLSVKHDDSDGGRIRHNVGGHAHPAPSLSPYLRVALPRITVSRDTRTGCP